MAFSSRPETFVVISGCISLTLLRFSCSICLCLVQSNSTLVSWLCTILPRNQPATVWHSCFVLSRLLVGFRTHFKSLHFHSFIYSFIHSFIHSFILSFFLSFFLSSVMPKPATGSFRLSFVCPDSCSFLCIASWSRHLCLN